MKLNNQIACYEISAEDLFSRPDFQKWLNRRVGKGLATWHTGGKPYEMSDIFLIYDHKEVDESSVKAGGAETGMPAKCWEMICEFCESHDISYGILRLVNTYDRE